MQTGRLAITHVTIVDTRTGLLIPDQTVIVQNGRVLTVAAASAVPHQPDDTVVDGHNKYLIPGLWDCHIHLSWTTVASLPLLVATGVTEVRDLGSNFSQIEGWRARIAAGELVGPHIMRAGPILNGKSFNQYQFVPGSAEATRGAVRLLQFLAVDEIKTHRRIPRDWYFAALDEAKKLHIPLVGHIPMEVTPEEASNAGQYMIEHTETLLEGTFSAHLASPAELPDAIRAWLATPEPDKLFATFVRNGTWLDPTLVGYFDNLPLLEPSRPPGPYDTYVAASNKKAWDDTMQLHPVSADDLRGEHAHIELLVPITARMHKDHVRLVAGTDAAGPRVAGFSLHHEMGYLVRAGLTPLEALQAATLNPAMAFHREKDLGAVEAGKLGDLVILDANPLADIRNTEKIQAVVQDGTLYRRSDLDGLLALSRRLAAVN